MKDHMTEEEWQSEFGEGAPAAYWLVESLVWQGANEDIAIKRAERIQKLCVGRRIIVQDNGASDYDQAIGTIQSRHKVPNVLFIRMDDGRETYTSDNYLVLLD